MANIKHDLSELDHSDDGLSVCIILNLDDNKKMIFFFFERLMMIKL